MTRDCSYSRLRLFIIFLTIVDETNAAFQDYVNLQHPRSHLTDAKFRYGEYTDLSSINEEEEHKSSAEREGTPRRSKLGHAQAESTVRPSDTPDPNIAWDSQWATSVKDLGQLTAIDVDPNGRIAILSRGERVWGLTTFDYNDKFDYKNGPIRQNTITLYDRKGLRLLRWGKNMFYMPHGLTIDRIGNYWITDVALHQVFKFRAQDLMKNWHLLKSHENDETLEHVDFNDYRNRFNRTIVKPSMILGEAFQPGDDNRRFCKPTAVAVANNGDFFVADGYCNSRIVKFNKNGDKILQWGRSWLPTDSVKKAPPSYALFVPHSLALAEEQNLIYVADREDGRVLSYNINNGTFHREYKDATIGPKIYAIAYARERIYLVNGAEVYKSRAFHVRGYVIDTNSGKIVSQFIPGSRDMLAPHDIAVTGDGAEIYAVELDAHEVYRFVQDVSHELTSKTNVTSNPNKTRHHEIGALTDDGTSLVSPGPATGQLVMSVIISAMILISLCLAGAALVTRCQKRGCLLSVRKRAYWEAERREKFKLSNMLDSRQSKNFKIFEKRPNTRDFSKLSTEPETSEEERVEDSLII